MPKRVLIAEDEPNIAKSLTFLLERAGYQASVEADGGQVANRVWADAPDALILDVMMPGMDGYAVLRNLRADPRSAELPVMMLTAKSQQADRQMAIDAGTNAFVTKPFANADIIDALQGMLSAD